MLGIGEKIPTFKLNGVLDAKIREFSQSTFAGKWLVLFFYPKDFTFICPTEVKAFAAHLAQFRKEGAEVAGVSADAPSVHLEWIQEIGNLGYPLLSDETNALAKSCGVFDAAENAPCRANFIADPAGAVQYVAAYQANVGRSVEETLRVLAALKTGKMCPVDWKPGQETLTAR